MASRKPTGTDEQDVVELAHPGSDTTITVQAGSVGTYATQGWVPVGEKPAEQA